MRLRNDRVPALFILLVSISLVGWAQNPAPANAGPSQPAQPSVGNSPQTPTPSGEPAPPPAAGPTNPPAANQQPAEPSSPPAQPTPGQSVEPRGQQSQEQAPVSDSGVFVFKAQVENVIVHATVVDDKNHLVTNLPKTAFAVFENNRPQNILSFRQEDVPVAMGIVVDNSGSMREKRDKVTKAALNLVRSSNPQDEVFVVNFNDEYYLDQAFTNDIDKLREALQKVEARGGTALYDALVASADYLKKNARLQKRVLFVVTDGEDNASRDTLEQTVRWLQEENGPTVYAIGLLGEEKAHRARRALETIAQRTGGIAFLPRTLDEVDEISRTVAHDIRNQYTIGYKPSTPKSVGGYRSIHVEARAKGHGRLSVRTRSGYYPGQEPASP